MNKVKVKFEIRLTVPFFEVEIDEDKVGPLITLFEAENVQRYEDIEELLDLSKHWDDIINAAHEIEVEDLDIVPPEDGKDEPRG